MNKNRYLIVSLVFIIIISALSAAKIWNSGDRGSRIIYSSSGQKAADFREIIFSDGVNFEKHFLITNLGLPSEKLDTFRIHLKTSSRIDPDKDIRNPVYAFWHLTDSTSAPKTVKSFLFPEPLGSKKNSYIIVMKHIPGFEGNAESLMIGPFSRKDTVITEIEIIDDPFLDITLFIKQSKLINIYIPSILLLISFFLFLCYFIFHNHEFLLVRIIKAKKQNFRLVLSQLFFAFILFSFLFPFEIIFIKHRYFGYLPVTFSTSILMSFFFLSLLFFESNRVKTARSRIIFYIILLFWGLHIFISAANISQIKSFDIFFDISMNSIIAPVLVFIIAFILFTKDKLEPVLKALFLSVAFLCFLSLLELFLGYNILYDNIISLFYRSFFSFQIGNRISASMVHPLVFASLLLIYFPQLFQKIISSDRIAKKPLYAIAFIFILTALVMTVCRGAIIIAIVYSALYILKKSLQKSGKSYRVAAISIILLTALLFFIPNRMIDPFKKRFSSLRNITKTEEYIHRKNSYRAAYNVLHKNLLFGDGLGNVGKAVLKNSKSSASPEKISRAWYTTDNYYLYILIERGLIGFITLFFPIMYIIYISWLDNRKLKNPHISALLAGVILFLAHMTMIDGLNWIMLYIHFYFIIALILLGLSETGYEI